MKTFLFLLLAGYAVRCDDSNYYVVQMPDNDVLPTKDFRVYWNVPTMQCKSKKIYFEDLYEKYGILQNEGDTFRGDKISILYDPGDFPALLRNATSGEIKYRNGGVPQEGDLIRHLDTFQKVLEQSVPDKEFAGVGIIDFESWKPVLRQNFGILTPYKDVSYEIEKKRHWWWKKQWIEEEAKRRFEGAGREFMQATVSLAKKMRPHAVWGYYGFPYCFNMAFNNRREACADKVPQENDRIGWLWQESTALYPSVYSSDDITSNQLAGLIRGRVREAARVAGRGAPIYPYFWYRYRDKGYFNESDLDIAFSTFYKSNASGFIIWGSSNDVNTIDKCKKLKNYVTNTLGPAIARYTKRNMKLGDDPEDKINIVYNPNNASRYDPEYTWIPPVNYTQKIEEMVDKELKEEKEAALKHKDVRESILIDMVLDIIANYCAEGCDNKTKVRQTDEEEGDGVINESRVVLVTEDPFKKNDSRIAVTVPTTTEEDNYDYDNTGDAAGDDIYETNEYIDVSTAIKSIDKSSTSTEDIEEVSTTTARAVEISVVDIRNGGNGTLIIVSKEENSIVSNEESKEIVSTTEADDTVDELIIEEIDATDFRISSESIEEISTTTTRAEKASIVDIKNDESDTLIMSKENNSTANLNAKENKEIVSTTEADDTVDELIIEEIDGIDFKIDENNSEKSTTEISTTALSSEELSSKETNTTESPFILSQEETIAIKNGFSIHENDAESNSIELVFIDVTTEESSTNNFSTAVDSTTEGSNSFTVDDVTLNEFINSTVEHSEDGTTTGTKSDSGTTLAPVLTEQVLGSVSRAIASKPIACSLFYIYSISRCICFLFGNC